MSATVVKRMVTVGEGGRIELDAPELTPGTRAEVVVTPASPFQSPDRAERLAAFDEFLRVAQIDQATAAEWLRQIRDEREARADKLAVMWEQLLSYRTGDDPL